MIVDQGDKIHIVLRRHFDNEIRRHFVGEVAESNDSIVRAEGYVFVFDDNRNEYRKHMDLVTRIISLSDAGNIITMLPREASLQQTEYIHMVDGRLAATDKKTFKLFITEDSHNR